MYITIDACLKRPNIEWNCRREIQLLQCLPCGRASIVKSKFDPSPQGGLRGGGVSQNAIYTHSIYVGDVKYNIIRKKAK